MSSDFFSLSDVEKPVFTTCITTTQTVDMYSVLRYTLPVAKDNSNAKLEWTYSMVPGEIITGDTKVTVTAKDPAGNSAECSFEVKVKGNIFHIFTTRTFQNTVEHTYDACPKYSELGSFRIIAYLYVSDGSCC